MDADQVPADFFLQQTVLDTRARHSIVPLGETHVVTLISVSDTSYSCGVYNTIMFSTYRKNT